MNALFSSRELAAGIWLTVIFVLLAATARGRKSLANLIHAALHWKILSVVALTGAYTSFTVWILRTAGAWTSDLLKDTVVWFLFSGLALIGPVATDVDNNSWRRAVLAQVKVVALVEYLLNTYTFSLMEELILQPVIAALAMVTVVAHSDRKYGQVESLMQGLQALVGFGILALALSQAIQNFNSSHTPDAIRSAFLAPVLSAMSLPWLYMLVALVRYENLFLRLRIGPPKAKGVRRYAIRKTICRFGLRAEAIRAFTQTHALELMRVQEKVDIDRLLTP